MVPFFALLALQAPTIDPATEGALAKPITLHLALRSVKDVVKAMATASGQPLDVVNSVSDRKATVLVKGLPAGRTMEALADALGLAWRKENGIYRLFNPPEAVKAEAAYVAEERAAAGKAPTGGTAVAVEEDAAPVEGRRPGRRGGRRPSYIRFDPDLLAFESARSTPPSRLVPGQPAGTSAFAKANAAWPTVEKGLDAAWDKPMRPLDVVASTWEGGALPLSDLLVAWHDATGLPVVADAFRLPMKATTFAPGTPLNALQGLAGGNGLALRVAGGVARMRHPAYWRLQTQEVPESDWRSLELTPKPALADLARFAAGLTAPQAAAFRSLEAPLSHVKTESVREAYPALRLWATLSGPVQSALLAGRPVPLSAVSSDAYAFALREAPYYKAGDPTTVLELPPARLGLFATGSAQEVILRLGPERGGGPEYPIALP